MLDIRVRRLGSGILNPGTGPGRWNFNVFRKSNPGSVGISTVPGGDVPKTLEFQRLKFPLKNEKTFYKPIYKFLYRAYNGIVR